MSNFSVKKPYTVFVGVVIILVLGMISFMNLTTDLLPSMELPYVAIITTYPGATPEKVEEAVSKPIEQGMMGISNIENVTSTSSENYSMVLLEFNGESNMDSVMIEISQKLDVLKANLEEGVQAPTVMQINPNMMPVLMSAVDMENADSSQITEFVETTLVPELERVDGVASVDTYGAIENELIIKLNQDKINQINDKMLASVSAELADKKRDLDKAKKEINSGKSKLETTKTEKTQEIANGIAAVESGRNEITKAEIELQAKQTELNQTKAELEGNLAQITVAENEMNAKKQELETGLAAFNGQINELQAQKTALEARKTELEAKQTVGQITVAELLELNEIINQIAQLVTVIQGIESNETFVALKTGLEQINQKQAEVVAGKEQLTSGLAQISSGLAQMSEATNTINSKKAELDSTSSMLQVAQSTLVSETTKAETQLDIAQKELDQGLEQFEDARDKALEQASIDGIITTDLVSQILTAENFAMPAGYVNENITVKIGDKFSSIEEIQNLVLFHFDMKDLEEVKLSDLADIEVSNNGDDIYAKVNGNNGIVLAFSKQSTASTKDVSSAVQEKLASLEQKYDNISFTNLMDQGIYIDMIIGSVMQSLVIGGILAIIVLFLFLKEWRPTIIVAVSIPVSVVFAIAMMYFSGITINIMSLSGLALGVGMLVDNSIVVIENIYRLKKEGKDVKEAAMQGAKSVTGAIIASTLTTICVFLPIVFVQGMSRQLFQDIGLTIAYSLIASLIMALTVVPAMASKLLHKVTDKENKFINHLSNIYAKLLGLSLKCKPVVIILVVVLLGTSIYLTTKMDIEFIPEVASDEMSISITMPKESSFEETRNVADIVMTRILEITDIDKVGAIDNSTGSTMMNSSSSGVSMYLILGEERSMTNEEIARKIEELTADLNAEIEVSTSEMDMSAMMASGISVQIMGNDIDKLKQISQEIESKLAEIEGVSEIEGVQENASKEKRIHVNKNKAMKYNLTVAQVYSAVASKIKTEIEGTEVEIDKKEYQVIIKKANNDVVNAENLMNIKLDVKENEEEKTSQLSEIATLEDNTGLENIMRENNNRYVTVSCAIKEGYSATMVSREVENVLKTYEAPEGYSVQIEGELDSTMEYMQDLLLMIVVAILFIYLIMVAQFQSLKLPFIVMFTIPLAFTGGLLALFFTGQAISIIAMLGFLVLAGIVVNNGIVFVDCVNQLVEEGMERVEAIKQTGKLRLRPILMTALTTILGLLSMALGIGDGAEMTQPLGIVAIGGLLYATVLTLFFVPVLYDIFCKKKN